MLPFLNLKKGLIFFFSKLVQIRMNLFLKKKLLHNSVYSLHTEVMSKSSLNHLVVQSDGRGFSQLPVQEAHSVSLLHFLIMKLYFSEDEKGRR